MGSLCYKSLKIDLQGEDLIREILVNLKISEFSYTPLKSQLSLILDKNNFISKDVYIDYLADFFYDRNQDENIYTKLQSKLYEEFYNQLDENINLYIILLYAFPFLKIKEKEQSSIFVDILKNLYGDWFSYNDLYFIFFKIFEFCTYKVTKEIELNIRQSITKDKIFIMNMKIFNYDKIEHKIKDILTIFNVNREKLDLLCISREEIEEKLYKKKVFNINDIRDSFINEYGNF